MSPFLIPASPNFLCPPLAEPLASYTTLPSTVKVMPPLPLVPALDSSAIPNAVDSDASSSSVVDVDETTMDSAIPLRLVNVMLISSVLDMIMIVMVMLMLRWWYGGYSVGCECECFNAEVGLDSNNGLPVAASK